MAENKLNERRDESKNGNLGEERQMMNLDSSASHGMLPARSSSSGVSRLIKQYKEKVELKIM